MVKPIFPPFSIATKVLIKLAQDPAIALVIVICWQTNPWFPQFVRLVKPVATPQLIPAYQHPLQLPRTNLQHPIWDRLSLVAAIFSGTSQQRDCHPTSPRSSEHHGWSAHSQKTTHHWWLDFCNTRQCNPYQPTVSQLLDFLHLFCKLGLSCSAIWIHQSAISAIVIPGVPQLGKHWLLVGVSIYERNLSHETSATKINQDMGCQQSIVLFEKSWTKWITQFEATDIENSSFVDNLSWMTNSYTTYFQCYTHGPVPW